ncbi:hypothetical protein [Brevibacterium sp. 1718]|uniref:hypothetical protein n=1 Tax=Brevibacterium sp. 1718 TaxID=3413510 RepID=UPI003DA99131
MSDGLDVRAAVTRSMLGWGVVAGPFYIVFGLILALTRGRIRPDPSLAQSAQPR